MTDKIIMDFIESDAPLRADEASEVAGSIPLCIWRCWENTFALWIGDHPFGLLTDYVFGKGLVHLRSALGEKTPIGMLAADVLKIAAQEKRPAHIDEADMPALFEALVSKSAGISTIYTDADAKAFKPVSTFRLIVQPLEGGKYALNPCVTVGASAPIPVESDRLALFRDLPRECVIRDNIGRAFEVEGPGPWVLSEEKAVHCAILFEYTLKPRYATYQKTIGMPICADGSAWSELLTHIVHITEPDLVLKLDYVAPNVTMRMAVQGLPKSKTYSYVKTAYYYELQKTFEVSSTKIVDIGDIERDAVDELYQFCDAVQVTARQVCSGKGVTIDAAAASFVELATEDLCYLRCEKSAAYQQLVEDFDSAEAAAFDPRFEPSFFPSLHDYQQRGFYWLMNLFAIARTGLRIGALVSDDTGLGKTLQTLAFLTSVHEMQRAAGAEHPLSLVVCPSSLCANWKKEYQKWVNDQGGFEMAVGKRDQRIEAIERARENGGLLITSYALLRRDVPDGLYQDVDLAAMVLDESTAIKNSSTATHRACSTVGQNAAFRLCLAAISIDNNLDELANQLGFLLPGLGGRVAPEKRGRKQRSYLRSLDAYGLKQLLSPFHIRRTKEECLPGICEVEITEAEVELPPRERAVYDLVRHDALEELENMSDYEYSRSGSRFKYYTYCRMAAVDAHLLSHRYAVPDFGMSAKAAACLQEIKNICAGEGGHHIVVFCPYPRAFTSAFVKKLADCGVNCYFISGSTPTAERFDICNAYESDPGNAVFLSSAKTSGYGLDLVSGSHVIFASLDWTYSSFYQALSRVARQGQQAAVVQVRIISAKDTLDEYVANKVQTKYRLWAGQIEGICEERMPTRAELIALLRGDAID